MPVGAPRGARSRSGRQSGRRAGIGPGGPADARYTPAGMAFCTAPARSGSTLTSGAYFPGTVTST